MSIRGVGRVRFLSLRQTIAAELAEGWPMAEIYRRHQDKLGIKVGQFRLYVNAYVGPENLWTGRKAAAVPGKSVTPPAMNAPPKPRIVPSVNLKREDLF